MSQEHRPKARRIPSDEFQTFVQNANAAKNRAQSLIENAKREARRIVADAEAKTRDFEALTNKELRSFIDEDRLKRHAKTFIKALSTINTMRKSHEAMTPWLIELVDTSVHRIIGEMDSAETTARIVKQGVRDLQDAEEVQLTVHPNTLDHAKSVKDTYPDMLAAVQKIATNPELDQDVFRLTCHVGSLDLSVDARLDRILELIKTSPTVNPSPRVKP